MKLNFPALLVALVSLAPLIRADDTAAPAPTPEAMRSPVNQVFQFMEQDQFSGWSDGSTTKATAYLWIPEQCKKVRGLLILCANVPENMLSGHPAIRKVCTDNDLGIVWCGQSFFNFKLKTDQANDVAFLQQLLNGLAKTSGYDEVATVPWVPIGESGHLLMVDALVENAPDRCIAGIWLKNPHLPPKNREVPALVIFGSAQEWSQGKTDIRTTWNNVGTFYAGVLGGCKAHPTWPLSLTIDGESGHFDCSEKITHLVAHYIDLAAKARLSTDGSATLQPVDFGKGYLADIPVPGHENKPPVAAADAPPEAHGVPWFWDKDLAAEAQAVANINWNAQSQFLAFENAKGEQFPYSFNGITAITMNKKPDPLPDGTVPPMLESEADGITFQLKGVTLDKIPANWVDSNKAESPFVGAGEPLAQAPGPCTVEWLAGGLEPLGDNKFRIAPDRNWPSPLYIGVRHPGTDSIRAAFQPGQINRDFNSEGAAQTITFDPIADVKAGTASVPLSAKASSSLPVGFFVVVGPAIIQDGKVVFTPIPPRAPFPITVTVGAYQMGRYAEPKVKQAAIVRQTFHLLAP
jgi:hypothetical protein